MKKDDSIEQSGSLPKSQIEVYLIAGVDARMRLQATIVAAERTVGAEEVTRS